jgi:hypothetical protein
MNMAEQNEGFVITLKLTNIFRIDAVSIALSLCALYAGMSPAESVMKKLMRVRR